MNENQKLFKMARKEMEINRAQVRAMVRRQSDSAREVAKAQREAIVRFRRAMKCNGEADFY